MFSFLWTRRSQVLQNKAEVIWGEEPDTQIKTSTLKSGGLHVAGNTFHRRFLSSWHSDKVDIYKKRAERVILMSEWLITTTDRTAVGVKSEKDESAASGNGQFVMVVCQQQTWASGFCTHTSHTHTYFMYPSVSYKGEDSCVWAETWLHWFITYVSSATNNNQWTCLLCEVSWCWS